MQFVTFGNRIATENFNIGFFYKITFTDSTEVECTCIGIGANFVSFQRQEPELLFTLTLDNAATVLSIDFLGGGGTSDYEELDNKPKINNVELVGNKSLSDLGIQPTISDLDTIRSGAAAGATAVQPAALADYQPIIDSSHKLDADLVDDTSSTNKFATAAQLSQIETNKNNILSVDRTKATYTITSDNLFKPTYSNDNGVTIEYKNGVTKITGTPISNGWRNVGTVYLPVGTYHINSGQISAKPTIYVRQGTTNIGLLRGTERVGSAFTITEEGIYTVDAYLSKIDTYNFDNYLQVGTTSADVLDEYHTAFDNSFKKPFGSVKYEAIGDSLTYGFIGFDGGQQVRLDNPYPERVAQIIGTNYVYNKGQTGTTVANDTTVMESYYPMSNDTRLATYVNADVISIMGGTNDYIKATAMGTLGTADDTTFYGGLQKIINYLRTNNPTAFVFVIIPTITSGYSTANSAGNTFKDYKNAMIDVCEAYGVPYIDMSVYGELTNGYTSQWTVDGTHYNQNYTDKIFAPLIADFISRHYNRNTKY